MTTGLILALLLAPTVARGEPRASEAGLEVFVADYGEAYYDRPHLIRGVAYDVSGLARLRPAPGARVRARCGGAWAEVTADAQGLFELEVQVPADPDFGEEESPRLELEVRRDQRSRRFELPLSVRSPLIVVAETDRNEYEPGETVHFWSRVSDARTGRPLAGVPVRLSPHSSGPEVLRTSAAGVVTMDFPQPREEGISHQTVFIHVGEEPLQVNASASYTVGHRPTTDLFVTAEATPATVGPGEAVSLGVQVRSPTGFPVRRAEVVLRLGNNQTMRATTDADGDATLSLRAPEYSSAGQRGQVTLGGTVTHPGYGTADFGASYRVRPPEAAEVDLVMPRGGLVPEVRDSLILSIQLASGEPPAAGTGVEVRGAALEGGRSRATVDRYGFVAIPVRLTAGNYARHVGSSRCAQRPATTLEVLVEGEAPQQVELCVAVLESVQVLATLERPAVSPGEAIEVTLTRRPDVSRRPVVVELLKGGELIAVTVASATTNQVRITAPEDRLGIFHVRARPLLDPNGDNTSEGLGTLEPLLIRPATPSFPSLSLDQEVYSIRGQAQLTIHTPAKAPSSHVAILARDLAQHQGEEPFEEYFLQRQLRQAVLDPSTPEAALLVRVALAAFEALDQGTAGDDEGEDGGPALSGPWATRDPARRAFVLRSARAGEWMVAVEGLLDAALAAGTVDEISRGEGPGRDFLPEAVALALDGEEPPRTLSDGPVTTEMLTDVDPSFTFEAAARRVTRRRLVRLMGVLATQLDPEDSHDRPRGRSTEPPERWLSELVRRGVLAPTDLHDPWGGTFVLRRTGRQPPFTFAVEAEGYELLSPGPDGRIGTADDIRDPLARVVAEGTTYAVASGEDRLMAQLSAISPGAQALQDLLEAYDRLNDEALEELAGDALSGGYGSGSGYGRGAGGLRGRRARAPSIRCGSARVAGISLAGMVREDLPATLLFTAEAALDPSGVTTFPITLAEAPTTYLIEVILWRDDGWVWSASTRLRVDQDLIVDAPVPASVTVGDELLLPLRVSNRTKTARVVRLLVKGDDSMGLAPIETEPVTVPPRDAVEVPVEVALRRVTKGGLTVAAFSTTDEPLDAVRRKLQVRPNKRRAHDEAEVILRGSGQLELVVPEGATPMGTNRVTLVVGPAIFRRGEQPAWGRWIAGLLRSGPGRPSPAELSDWELLQLAEGAEPMILAHLVGACWLASPARDGLLDRALEVLEDHLASGEAEDIGEVSNRSRLLLLLAPAVLHEEARPRLRGRLRRLTRALRIEVESGAALFANAPWLSARAATALLWTAPSAEEAGDRARELLGRARAAVVEVGEDRWLEGGRDDLAGGGARDELFVASALLALAEIRSGRGDEAFLLVRSAARLLRSGDGGLPEVQGLSPEDRSMAAAAATALGGGSSPEALGVVIDGELRQIELDDAVGTLALEALGRGGAHRLELVDGGGQVVLLQATAEYAVAWSTPPPHAGPFALRLEGAPGGVDTRTELRLVIRNQVPRMIRGPVVELTLPAGAEVDLEARQRLARFTQSPPGVSADTLTLRLRPMSPRSEITIPLSWLWTTAGRLGGLGVMAWADDRPQAISIAASRQLEVEARGAAATGGNAP